VSLNTTPRTWVAGEVVTGLEMNTEIRDAFTGIQSGWDTWTPTFSSGLTVGNGSLTGSYLRVGKKVTCRGTFTFGSTSTVTAPRLQFPIAVSTSYAVNHALAGSAFVLDTSATGRFTHFPVCNDTVTGGVGTVYFISAAANALISGTVPMTWATGDLLSWSFTYEAA
jgi:hypothetical protein